MSGERTRGQFNIIAGYACPLCGVAPAINGARNFFNRLLGAVWRQPKEPRGGQDSLQTGAAVRVVDVQDMFRLVEIRIDVEGRSKPPPGRTQHETVIAQMVVPVADSHVERDPAEQLRKVRVRVGPVAL